MLMHPLSLIIVLGVGYIGVNTIVEKVREALNPKAHRNSKKETED